MRNTLGSAYRGFKFQIVEESVHITEEVEAALLWTVYSYSVSGIACLVEYFTL